MNNAATAAANGFTTIPTLLTVGHSDHTIEAFLALLVGAAVDEVADVRTLPGSRANPQFGHEALATSLMDAQIAYRRIPELGGLRRSTATIGKEVNGAWRNRSFHNYADYALSAEFATGLDDLIADSKLRRVAIMCAEAVWWRCHRRIIADHLIARGEAVAHLMPNGKLHLATLTPGAVVDVSGMVRYPASEHPT